MATNLGLAGFHLLVHAYQLYALPLLLLPQSGWWGLTLIPTIALSNPLWSLVHETIHGTFHPSPRANRYAGRLLGSCYGTPWRVLRVGHLLHHQLNRSPLDRAEAFDPGQMSWKRAAVAYYYQLLVGLYISQVLSPLAFFLPRRLLRAAQRRFLPGDSAASRAASALIRPEPMREIRIDGTVIAALLAGSAIAFGAWWPLLVVLVGGRAVCISFLDYVYHYGSPVDQPLHGYNLRLPPPAAWLLLNFNLHGVHHRDPRLPWRDLPAAFRADGTRFDHDYVAAALRQLRGPIASAALASHRRPGSAGKTWR